jgi:DNA-binding response OmpR family regulator
MARVLIVVERDPELGEFLREALARIGHQTLMTTNAAQGLRLLESAAPDLVITNVLVRELDRLESFQRLYGRPGPKIIAIGDDRDRGTASEMTERHSANRILYKPFTQTELVAAVKSVLPDRLKLVQSLVHSGLQFSRYLARSGLDFIVTVAGLIAGSIPRQSGPDPLWLCDAHGWDL